VALFNFFLPKIFDSAKSFDEWFNTPFANSGAGDKIEERSFSLFDVCIRSVEEGCRERVP
jgi:SNF2 family DNA or RNA helicase